MTTNQPFGKPHIHKSKIVNKSKKILSTFVLLLGTTALSGLPNIAMADEEMIIIADTDGNGVVDGTGSEWAASYSAANQVNSDGSVLAGNASNDGSNYHPFRWDATTGMVNLADTDGDGVVGTAGSGEWVAGDGRASSISSDGSVIGGFAVYDSKLHAFRWDATNGMVRIAGGWATGNSQAKSMSSDGSVIGGYAYDGTANRAFRWDATNGMVNIAGDWATGDSDALLMSSDGSVIGGIADDISNTRRIFRWDATNGMVNIADTDGDGTIDGSASEWATGTGYTYAISPDGSFISGYASDVTNIRRAFSWDATNGMVNIADANGDGVVDGTASEWATGNSTASAMSSDGSIIAGYANDGTANRAFRWDATNGMVNLADTDGDGTIDGSDREWATGYSSASAMSSDGSVIAGYANDGITTRAFIYRGGGGGVMLDATNTQTSIVQNASAQGAAVASVNSSISAIVQTEIEVAPPVRLNFFADPQSANKLPTAINIMASRSSNKNASNVSIGSITAAVALPNELTVGGFAALGTDGTSLSGFGFDGTLKAFGGFVRGASLGNTKLAWKASIATSGGDVTIARDSSLTGTEAASGNSKLTSKSASFEVGYKTLLIGQAVSPYLRLTRAITTRDAYTEQANSFPIAYSENKQTATTATVGIKMQTELTSNIALRYGLGVDFDLARSDAAIEGTSQIPGMTSISVAAPAVKNKARLIIKSGLTKFYYDGSSMSFDLGIQQNTYSSGTTVIGSVGYTVQF